MGDTIYGFSSSGHLVIMNAHEDTARTYQLDLAIDEVYGVTKDGVAVVSSMGTICLVDLE